MSDIEGAVSRSFASRIKNELLALLSLEFIPFEDPSICDVVYAADTLDLIVGSAYNDVVVPLVHELAEYHQREPANPYEQAYVEDRHEPLAARISSDFVVELGRQAFDEKLLLRECTSLLLEVSRKRSSVATRGRLLHLLKKTALTSLVEFEDAAAVTETMHELRKALQRNLEGDRTAIPCIVNLAGTIAQLLPETRGKRMSKEHWIHTFALALRPPDGRSAYTYGPVSGTVSKESYIDGFTQAARSIHGSKFNPQSSRRNVKALGLNSTLANQSV